LLSLAGRERDSVFIATEAEEQIALLFLEKVSKSGPEEVQVKEEAIKDGAGPELSDEESEIDVLNQQVYEEAQAQAQQNAE